MVNAVAEFLVGAAVIVTPQYQVPLLIGGAALKLGTSLVSRGNKSGDSQEEVAHNGGEILLWQHLCLQGEEWSYNGQRFVSGWGVGEEGGR